MKHFRHQDRLSGEDEYYLTTLESIVEFIHGISHKDLKIDETFNDVYLFCWNDGCTPDQVGQNIEKNILYMTRDIIDAGIVWWEGVPEGQS